MFIVYIVVLGIVAGYIRGGSLRRITRTPLKRSSLVITAIAIQLVIFSELSFVITAPQLIITSLQIISYILIIIFLIINYKVPGLLILGAGVVLNSLVIFLNGGYMPSAHTSTAVIDGRIDNNIVAIAHDTVLPWLGDIFRLPKWLPFTNWFSIGDILIGVGVFLYFYITM